MDKPIEESFPTALRFLALVAFAIFACEILLLGLNSYFKIGDCTWDEAIVDSIFLTLIVAPFLYAFLYRRMLRYRRESESAQERLSFSEQYLRSIIDNEPECVKLMDEDCMVIDMNPAGIAMVEADDAGMVIGQNKIDMVDPEFREAFREFVKKVCRGEPGAFTFAMTGLKGTKRWLESRAVPFRDARDGRGLLLSVTRDITERRRAEEAFRSSEERFKVMFEYAPDAYFITDTEGVFIELNRVAEQLSGYGREALIGKNMFELSLLPSEEFDKATELKLKSKRGEPAGPSEFAIRRGDGSRAHVEVRTYPLDMDGKTLVLGIARDITERKRAEASLVESRSFLSNILESIQDGLCIVGTDRVVVMANSTMEKWFAHRGAVVGRKCHEVIRGKDEACDSCPALETMKSGRSAFDTIPFTRADGAKGWLDMYTFPLTEGSTGEVLGVIVYLRDITDKVVLEAETARVSQLASLGELAAGVAHEINNPVNGIINYAQILANRLPEGNGNGEIARRIIREGDRISEIVKSLLSFARDEGAGRTDAEVGEMLLEVLSLTGSHLRRDGIRLVIDVPDGLPEIHVNRQQVEQVFLNVINNARYALKKKYPGPDKDKVLEINGEEISAGGGAYVRLSFRDRGVGIPEDIIDKVTNPFFTTKPRGSGTGLGLSISHNIIQNHGGRLAIESAEGKYTAVTIDLPVRRGNEG